MQVERIFLAGPRACGKTTVGKALAERLGWRFIDTDELVVRGAGCTVARIVERMGWGAFRDMEAAALQVAAESSHTVVATGGGMVLREANRTLMRTTGLVVVLHASVPVLAARLAADPLHAQRPSLTEKRLEDEVAEVLAQRAPLYNAVAHVRADAGQPVEEIVDMIIQALESGGK